MLRAAKHMPALRPAYARGGPVATGLSSGLYGSDIGQGALQQASAYTQQAASSGGGGQRVRKGPNGSQVGSLAGAAIGSFIPGIGTAIGGAIGGILGSFF